MDTKIIAEVEKLIAWRITTMGPNPSVDAVIDALKKGNLNTGAAPIHHEALSAFRKRNRLAKEMVIQRVLERATEAPSPLETPVQPAATSESETVPSTVSASRPHGTAEIQSVRSEALADVARRSGLELKEEEGEVYITLRCFEQLIGKTPENLRRTLEARGFPIRQVWIQNERKQVRQTPGILIAYIFAVVGLADLHGMEPEEREKLFALQRDMPNWMKRFNELVPTTKDEPKSILAAVGSLVSSLRTSIIEGFSRIGSRFESRFDRIETLLGRGYTQPTQQPSSVFVSDPARVETRRITDTGGAKLVVRRPLVDIHHVVQQVNQYLCTNYTPEDIIRVSEREGIYEREPWGVDKAGNENATILDGGAIVTWHFDLDSVDLLKTCFRKDTVATNSAMS
jgi:hypothetical protein